MTITALTSYIYVLLCRTKYIDIGGTNFPQLWDVLKSLLETERTYIETSQRPNATQEANNNQNPSRPFSSFKRTKLASDSNELMSIEDEIRAYKQSSNLYLQEDANGEIMWESADPLAWWTALENLYPRIACLAEKVLRIPASSAPAERVFSNAGATITDTRTRVTPAHVTQLLDIATRIKDI